LFALSLSPNVCCDSDEGRESKTPAIADIVTNKEQMSKKLLLVLAASLLLTCCTKEGDVIYQTDPADAPSTTPLVTVIYDPNAVGDGNYNDLIYQSVEQAAKEHDLRTMHLSPSPRDAVRADERRTGHRATALHRGRRQLRRLPAPE